ncbi:MAG: hypothetical protein Q9M10_02690 [Mariprofundaceae bacterium]|nr:hypothetical protein [Mariprofundaceae bacterium]
MTNAERQKKYRSKNFSRINTFVSSEAKLHLNLLAKHYAVTKREILEKLLEEAKESMIEKMTSKEIDALYGSLYGGKDGV